MFKIGQWLAAIGCILSVLQVYMVSFAFLLASASVLFISIVREFVKREH